MHFVDTNLLVYGFDESDPVKRDRARLVIRRLWEARSGRLSHQVLHCATVLSEDLQNGLEFEGMRILNPFAGEFDPDRLGSGPLK